MYTTGVVHAVLDKEEPGDGMCAKGQRLGWVPLPTAVGLCEGDPASETHRKHCSRSPRAKWPAWYSFPSITEGTVSVSCTMTAISLSRFPSMLRSFMLAEPIKRNSETETFSYSGRHSFALQTQFFLAKKPLILFRYQEMLCSRKAGCSLTQG